jgi:manganese transport protein
VVLNLKLALEELSRWLSGGPLYLWIIIVPLVALMFGLLLYIILAPLFGVRREWESGLIKKGQEVVRKIRPITFKHIAVALENSDRDAEILSAALTMAQRHKSRLTLLHVADSPGTMVYGDESSSLHSREDEKYLEDLAREIEEKDLPVETQLLFGDPATELIRAINENGFDLLVAGSHGHHGVGDWVHGTTIDKVRHGIKIPVLIVRGKEDS